MKNTVNLYGLVRSRKNGAIPFMAKRGDEIRYFTALSADLAQGKFLHWNIEQISWNEYFKNIKFSDNEIDKE